MSAVVFDAASGIRSSGTWPEASRSGDVQALTTVRRIVVARAKGGQGTTTVAAAMAVFAAGHRPTRLMTSDPGAAAAVLGVTVPVGTALLGTPVIERLELATEPVDVDAFTVVDAGRIEQFPESEVRVVTVAVVRGPCYLALRCLVGAGGPQPDGIVLYPGSRHWHYRRGRERGTLEITFWPAQRRLWLKVAAGRTSAWITELLPSLQAALAEAGQALPVLVADQPQER